jgi:hypothetical protein
MIAALAGAAILTGAGVIMAVIFRAYVRWIVRRLLPEDTQEAIVDGQNWTPCEEYGHRFELDGEQFGTCLDCGEPRERVAVEGTEER